MAKYADDTYLLVGGYMRHTLHEEIGNVSLWADENNLRLNPQKTKEMLVARHSSRFLPPPLLDGVQRVTSLLVLEVTLEDNLRVTEHVERTLEACSRSHYALRELHSTLEACSRSVYALRELRSHGLPTRALYQVARVTTVAKMTYASSAWWGLTSAAERDRIERFLSGMKGMDYLGSAAQLVESAEDGLMRFIIAWEIHVLRLLCPPLNNRKYGLRPRPHNFLLPLRDDTTCNYILGLCLDGLNLTPDLHVIFPYNSYLILWNY